jgi:hypothetical protein
MGRDFGDRATGILQRIQPAILPQHAKDIVTINVDTGEYVLSSDTIEGQMEFSKRWPGTYAFQISGDGGPVYKFYGK